MKNQIIKYIHLAKYLTIPLFALIAVLLSTTSLGIGILTLFISICISFILIWSEIISDNKQIIQLQDIENRIVQHNDLLQDILNTGKYDREKIIAQLIIIDQSIEQYFAAILQKKADEIKKSSETVNQLQNLVSFLSNVPNMMHTVENIYNNTKNIQQWLDSSTTEIDGAKNQTKQHPLRQTADGISNLVNHITVIAQQITKLKDLHDVMNKEELSFYSEFSKKLVSIADYANMLHDLLNGFNGHVRQGGESIINQLCSIGVNITDIVTHQPNTFQLLNEVENKISVIESSITNLAKTSQEIQRISEQTKNWMYAAWEQNTDVGIDSCNSHSHPLLRIADTVDTLVQNYAILSNMIKDMNSNSHTYNNELANKFTTISRNAIKSLTEHFDTALSANKLALEQFHIKDSEVRNLVFQTMQQGLDGQATAIIELNKYTMDLPVNIGILLDESSQNLNSELAAKFESLINFNKNLVEELFTLEQRARQKFLDMMHSELVAFQSIIEKLPTAVVDSLRNSLGHVEEMREREIAKLGEILLRQKSELDQLPDKIANGLQPVRELREREISQLEQILAKQKMDLERANKDLEQLWSNLIKKVNKK